MNFVRITSVWHASLNILLIMRHILRMWRVSPSRITSTLTLCSYLIPYRLPSRELSDLHLRTFEAWNIYNTTLLPRLLKYYTILTRQETTRNKGMAPIERPVHYIPTLDPLVPSRYPGVEPTGARIKTSTLSRQRSQQPRDLLTDLYHKISWNLLRSSFFPTNCSLVYRESLRRGPFSAPSCITTRRAAYRKTYRRTRDHFLMF